MAFEDQANSKERLNLAVKEMTQDIKKEMPEKLMVLGVYSLTIATISNVTDLDVHDIIL